MKNKLTDKDVKEMERIIGKCNTIQLCLYIGRFNDKLYHKLKSLPEKSISSYLESQDKDKTKCGTLHLGE